MNCLSSYIVPDLNIPFVDRTSEFKSLLDLFQREVSWIHVLTGPWGCGKTEFARAVTHCLSNDSKFIILYTNLTESEIDKALSPTHRELSKILNTLIRDVLHDVLKIPLSLYTVLEYIKQRIELRDKTFIVIIDEITRSLETYKLSIRDYVSGLSKKIYEIEREYKCKTHVLLLTSDQTAAEFFDREQGKNLTLYLMWNLDKDSTFRLLEELSCSTDFEIVWKLTGGNPREICVLKIVYGWNIEKWLESKIEYCREVFLKARDLDQASVLKLVVENIDEVPSYSPEMEFLPRYVLINMLYRLNIIIRVDARLSKISKLPNEPWIGKRRAFQQPVYYWILRTILTKGMDITPRDVLRNIE